VWDWTRAAEFLWDLRAQELSSATKKLTVGNLLTRDQWLFVIKPSSQRFSRDHSIL